MKHNQKWATRFGFYFIAIGSAFGLGCLWRFPYMVLEHGGGAFVFLYLVLLTLVGIPLLIGELTLGKATGKSIYGALLQIRREKSNQNKKSSLLVQIAPTFGIIAVVTCIVIFGYYSVISGWVLSYITKFVLFAFGVGKGVAPLAFDLNDKPWVQFVLASAHVMVVVWIVSQDFELGIEKVVGYIMPLFVVLMFFLTLKSFSLASANDALRFLLYPDFSRLKLNALAAALGQIFFTLSIGISTMVTFGSYLDERHRTPVAGFRVATIDAFSSLLAGMLIFPLLIAAPVNAKGPDLLFKTLPALLAILDWGALFGIGFFVFLYLAALGASLSLVETVISNLVEIKKISRRRASVYVGMVCLAMATIATIVGGSEAIAIMDLIAIQWVAPVLALVFCLVVGREVNSAYALKEFLDPDDPSQEIIFRFWKVFIQFLAPAIIVLALVLQVIHYL